MAPHYLAEPFASALAPPWESSDFFCHIIWRQREGSTTRVKRVKKATPCYVAEPFGSLCCIYKGFGGICATLSGGNPPRYETNHIERCRFSLWHWQFHVRKPIYVTFLASKTGNISGARGSGKSILCQSPSIKMLTTPRMVRG